jgi:hypothetical protein
MAASDLDRLVDKMRGSVVDLAILNRAPDPAQVDAMVDVVMLHHFDELGECDCGWKFGEIVGQHFEVIERAYLRHVMADICERVFKNPLIR